MKTEGGLFIGDTTQSISHPRDWGDDGGRKTKPLQTKQSSDPHLPETILRARRRQSEDAKEKTRAAKVADSHLDNQHYLQSAQDVNVVDMLRMFQRPTLSR